MNPYFVFLTIVLSQILSTQALASEPAVDKEVLWDNVIQQVRELPIYQIQSHRFEQIELSEEEHSEAIAKLMFDVQMGIYEARKIEGPGRLAHRDAHAKGHGCYEAQFKVTEDLDQELISRVFVPGRSYEGVARFSNGAGTIQTDFTPDGRGLALKLLDVPADASLSPNLMERSSEQDFMLINGDRFFVRNVADYLKMQTVVAKSANLPSEQRLAPFFLERTLRETLGEDLDDAKAKRIMKVIAEYRESSPLRLAVELAKQGRLWPLEVADVLSGLSSLQGRRGPEELIAALEIQAQPTRNPLDYSYSSLSPYLLQGGGRDQAVKYQAQPVDCDTGEALTESAPLIEDHSMQDALLTRLEDGKSCFNFSVQVLNPHLSMVEKQSYVEDATSSWSGQSSLKRIGEIEITPTKYSDEDCQRLSFNPWNSYPEHRPLGGINRTRRMAVSGSFVRRHLINKN